MNGKIIELDTHFLSTVTAFYIQSWYWSKYIEELPPYSKTPLKQGTFSDRQPELGVPRTKSVSSKERDQCYLHDTFNINH